MDFFGLIFYFIIIVFIIIVPSSIFHEYAHGWMAEKLGDPTARYAGRLTLNPLAHIDPVGTLLLPILLYLGSGGSFMFAYAKPVPFNPYNLRNQKWGPALVGLAGPSANFFLAAAFALLYHLIPHSAVGGLLPIVVKANVLLMVFNLVPIPPLDGSKLLFALLPDSMQNVIVFLERWGYILLFFFVIYLFNFIQPIITLVFNWLIGPLPPAM